MVLIVDSTQELEERLATLLKQCHLDRFLVDVDKIKRWISELEINPELHHNCAYLTMLAGLLNYDSPENTELIENLLDNVCELYQHTPITALGNKPVWEDFKDRHMNNEPAIISLNTIDLPPRTWIPYYKATAVRSLSKTLLRDQSYIVRRSCAEALGKIRDKSVVKYLINAMSMDTNQFVRSEIALTLGILEDSSAIEILTKASRSQYRKIVKAAKKALEQIRESSE